MPKVLLADDDFNMVSLLNTILKLEGYQVSTLMDQVGDPLENIRRDQPDVLIMDLCLGNCDGLDILSRIRASEDLKNLKVIMVSGLDRGQDCLAAGANTFLLKPYMPEDLFAALRTCTRDRERPSPA
jgi:DNA-binding response OmpR family regulator